MSMTRISPESSVFSKIILNSFSQRLNLPVPRWFHLIRADKSAPANQRDPIQDFEALSGFDSKSLYLELRKYELHFPEQYGLYLVRSLVAARARIVEIIGGSISFEIRFAGGDFTATVLDQLASGVLKGGWSSIYLLWALEACRKSDVQWIRFHHQHQCWQFEAEGSKKFSSSESGLIQVKRRFGLGSLSRYLQAENLDLAWIRQTYRYSNQSLLLNSKVLAPELFPHKNICLARYTNGASVFPHYPGLVSLTGVQAPPGPVELIVSCWLLDDKRRHPSGVSLYLAGAFQERIFDGFEGSIFDFDLALDGIELDRSLVSLRRGRCWEEWTAWLRALDIQLLPVLCDLQNDHPRAAVADALASRFWAELLAFDQQSELLLLLEKAPLFVRADGQICSLHDLRTGGASYHWLEACGFSKKDRLFCQSVDPKLAATVLVLSESSREILLRYQVPLQSDGRAFLGLPPRKAKATRVLSRHEVNSRHKSATFLSFAGMQSNGQTFRLGSLVLDCVEGTVSGAGFCYEICELNRFEIYTYVLQGDTKTHHFVLIVIESDEREMLFGDRGKDYPEWNAELSREFQEFSENLKAFCQAAQAAGASICRPD
jgi:hypothetical protein